MSGRPFDRDPFRNQEFPKSLDLNRLSGEGADAGLRFLMREVFGPQTSLANPASLANFFGFYGTGFLVVPESPASTSVRILSGLGAKRDDTDLPSAIGGIAGLDELSDVKPIVLRTPFSIPTPAAPASPNQRYDIVEVAVRRDLYDSIATSFLQLPDAKRVSSAVTKTLSYAVDNAQVPYGYVTDPANSTAPISYKIGQASASPVVPPTSPGYVKIAQILVDNVVNNPAGTIRQEHIADFRPMLFAGGTASFSLTASFVLGTETPPTILHASVPPGIRLAVNRLSTLTMAGPLPNFIVYVLNNLRDAQMQTGYPRIMAPAAFDLARGEQGVIAAVQNADKLGIDNANLTFPVQKVPIGQPMQTLYGEVWSWASPNFALSANPTIYFTARGTLT